MVAGGSAILGNQILSKGVSRADETMDCPLDILATKLVMKKIYGLYI